MGSERVRTIVVYEEWCLKAGTPVFALSLPAAMQILITRKTVLNDPVSTVFVVIRSHEEPPPGPSQAMITTKTLLNDPVSTVFTMIKCHEELAPSSGGALPGQDH